MRKSNNLKKVGWTLIGLFTALGAIMLICDRMVVHAAKDRLYDDVVDIPHRKVGLVLGTSPISSWNGRRNYYYDHRIKAAADLYNAGKVDWLVVSGGDYRNFFEFKEDEAYTIFKQNKDRASKLVSLAEYKPRENVEKDYLHGRYGAIPTFQELNK